MAQTVPNTFIMKQITFLFALLLISKLSTAQIYLSKSCDISFFSESPVENIDAVNKDARALLNTVKHSVVFRAAIKGFEFKKPLMQEHFNETYLESDTYPKAVLRANIVDTLDYSKDGTHKVTVKGTLELHGVTKDVTYEGTITIKGETITIVSTIVIVLADFNIDVPTLQKAAISEEIEVKVNAILTPYQKKK